MIIEKQLIPFAEEFLRGNFNTSLTIPIKQNNRLRSTLGRYVMSNHHKPLRIELSGTLLTYGTIATIKGVLKHECIHYAYHKQGKRMHDGDAEFEAALKKFNAPSTNTLKVGEYYIFTCSVCNETGETRLKRLAKYPQQYRTNCCRGHVQITGTRIYRGI